MNFMSKPDSLLLCALLLMSVVMTCGQTKKAPSTTATNDEPPPAAAEYSPQSWKEFKSQEGGFSVIMPGIPKEMTQTGETSLGKVVIHAFRLDTFAFYQVSYFDFPKIIDDPVTSKNVIDKGRDGMVLRSHGKLISEAETTLDGHPSRLMLVELEGGFSLKMKAFVSGKRLYMVGIGLPPDQDAPLEIKRFHEHVSAKFLDSFKIMSSVNK